MTETSHGDRIRNRIEKALRLAEDPGASESERNNALERVAVLVDKYQIDATSLNPHSGQYTQEDIVTHTFPIPARYGLGAIRHHGLYSVASAMGAGAYVLKNGYAQGRRVVYRHEGLVVHAVESTMHVLKALIPSLILQEANGSAAYIKKTKETDPHLVNLLAAISTVRGVGADPKEWQKELDAAIRLRRKSFCLAFFVEAADRIKEKRSDAVQEAGKGYELVLVDAATRIQRSLEELDLDSRKPRADRKFSADGWDNGTRAGRAAMVGQTELHGGRLELGR